MSEKFKELESCRNLIRQLEDEAKNRSPVGSEPVDPRKLDAYIILLRRIQQLKVEEENLLTDLTGVSGKVTGTNTTPMSQSTVQPPAASPTSPQGAGQPSATGPTGPQGTGRSTT